MSEERSCEEAFAEWWDELNSFQRSSRFGPSTSDIFRAGFTAATRTPTLPAASRDAVRDFICDNIFGPLAYPTSPPSDAFRYNACEPLAEDMLAKYEIRERAAGDRPPAEREEAT